ncbi:MAG: imidazole glycerol phosphate synthase subunit HisH [Vicinamibacterales bacterium]
MPTVAIVDYGLCNLDSVRRAVEECGGRPVVTARPEPVLEASHVILPGVGAFPEAMATLRRSGLAEALTQQVIARGVPFLGICLGMQLMAARGTEGGVTDGLGWIPGEVRRLEGLAEARVPHVGWNEVHATRPCALLDGVAPGADVYFVHSYAMVPSEERDIVATTPRGEMPFVSIVQRDNVAGVQFHPEKSQRVGFAILRNFLRDGVPARV